MAEWGARRQASIIGFFLMLLAIVVGLLLYATLKDEPTCFDGVMNGVEAGVDCGGTCEYLCTTQTRPTAILWSRSFPVTSSTVNAVALVENPNFNAGVANVPYVFKLFDSNNTLIVERHGETYLSTNGITPIFEPRIEVGDRAVARTFFEFKGDLAWQAFTRPKQVRVEDQRIVRADVEPRIEARVVNDRLEELRNVEVVAVVYNTQGNAIAVSRTVVLRLPQQSSEPVFFVWPRPFPEVVARIDIIPRIPPEQQR